MQVRSRFWLVVLVTVLFMLMIAGCTSSKPAPEGNSNQSATGSDGVPLPDKTVMLNMGSTSPTSSHYALQVAVAQSVEKGTNGKIKTTVVESGGSLDNLRRLKRGDFQWAQVTPDVVYQSVHGLPPFEEKWDDVRTMFVYQSVPEVIVVRADSGVTKVEDLDGKPFSPGQVGSATESNTMKMFEILGIKPNYLHGSGAEYVDAIKDKRSVGFVKGSAALDAPDATVLDVGSLIELRFLTFTPEQINKIKAEMPTFFSVEVPAGIYKGQDHACLLRATVLAFNCTKDLDENLVYHMMKSAFENKEMHDEAYPGVKNVNYAELTLEYSLHYLHAGAVKYLEEIGYKVPDKLIPPEAK